jgi:hypothetical protein
MKTEEAKQIYKQRSLVCRIPARLDQAALRAPPVSISRKMESLDGSGLGLSELQHHALV